MPAKLKLARLGTFLNSPTWRVLVYYGRDLVCKKRYAMASLGAHGRDLVSTWRDMVIFQFCSFLSKNNTG